MPDSKITALASTGTGTDPANDPLVIVDVSDTSMAATGTTKKVTLNQLLACSPTATLASATITGDLTVRTNKLAVTSTGVGIGTASPAYPLQVAGRISYSAGIGEGTDLTVSSSGTVLQLGLGSSWTQQIFYLTGTTAMTLNSTGLLLGTTATGYSAANRGLFVAGGSTSGMFGLRVGSLDAGYLLATSSRIELGGSGTTPIAINNGGDAVIIDTSRNVGVGVVPSAWGSAFKAVDFGTVGGIAATGVATRVAHNSYNNGTNFIYKASSVAACLYEMFGGEHRFSVAPSGTAGNAITFTQAMTLDASGNLLVGTTTNTNSSRAFIRGTGGAILALQSATGDTANPGLLVGKFDNDSTTSQILVRFTINNNASGSGQITANGANAAAFGTFSDSRLKENIASIPSQLEKIVSLRPVEFDFKNGSGHQIGFVAQEMQEVYPDVVGEQDGFLTVTGWSKTEARLVSAIKELAAKVQALEAKLA
jgi:hypothetical protein